MKQIDIISLESVLQTNNVTSIKDYFNERVNLKVQKRDVIKLLKSYQNNTLDLQKYVFLWNKYPLENLRTINNYI